MMDQNLFSLLNNARLEISLNEGHLSVFFSGDAIYEIPFLGSSHSIDSFRGEAEVETDRLIVSSLELILKSKIKHLGYQAWGRDTALLEAVAEKMSLSIEWHGGERGELPAVLS